MTDDDRTDESPVDALEASLLHAPVADDDRPVRRSRFPLKTLLVSAFIAYHSVTLLIHNLPSRGLTKEFNTSYMRAVQGSRYLQVTSLGQSWKMFAPNPPKDNRYVRVLVEDRNGEVWDMAHDKYGRATYPYLIYSRSGKINRRLFRMKRHREPYAAWVCRDWERTHGGEPAKEVRIVKMWTHIPSPEESWETLGYDPMELPLQEYTILTVPCATTAHAQLPPDLRERYGFPRAPDGAFVELKVFTWVDIERARNSLDRDAILAERRARLRQLQEEDPGVEDTE